jgi:nucleoside 2-deoxyribosyltransferase
MKIYIAANNQEAALQVAHVLEGVGHKIVSSWLREEFLSVEDYSEPERVKRAEQDTSDVLKSDLLILLAAPFRVSGGKFIEAGIALGAGKPVVILGHRENMLLWARNIRCYRSVEILVKQWPFKEKRK